MKAKNLLMTMGLLLVLIGVGLIGTFVYASVQQPLNLTAGSDTSFTIYQYDTSPQATVYSDEGGSVTIDWFLDGQLVQHDLDISYSSTYGIPTNIAVGVHDLYALDSQGNIIDFSVTILSSTIQPSPTPTPIGQTPTPTPYPTPTPHPTLPPGTTPTPNPFKTPTPTSIISIPSDPLQRDLMAVVGILFIAAGSFSLWLKTRFY